ncbi:MAG: flippase-like domain-containing protein [Victivallaceae bacterium]|nr:flippase-like domain-containing protein [Victivallaceae bacterium]
MQTEKKKKNKIKSIFSFLLKTGLSIGIIWWLIHSNSDEFKKINFSTLNYWWFIPAGIAYIFHMLVCSWRWYKLALVLSIEITFIDAVALTMKGYFFSLVIPGGAIGGDVAKIGFLNQHTAKGAKAEGAFSILMDRMTGMAAMFSLALVVILLSIPTLMKVKTEIIEFNDTVRVLSILGLIVMCLAGLSTMICLFFHRFLEKIKPVGWLMNMGDKYGHGIVSRFTKVLDTYRNSWKLVVKMCLMSVLFVHLNIVFVVYLVMKSLGTPGFNPINTVTAVTVGNLAGLLPSIAGIGWRDATLNAVLEAASIQNGVIIAVGFSAILVSCHLLAGLFFIFDFSKKINKLS